MIFFEVFQYDVAFFFIIITPYNKKLHCIMTHRYLLPGVWLRGREKQSAGGIRFYGHRLVQRHNSQV